MTIYGFDGTASIIDMNLVSDNFKKNNKNLTNILNIDNIFTYK
jgi:hypothetical protein